MRGGDDGVRVVGTGHGFEKYETRTDRPKHAAWSWRAVVIGEPGSEFSVVYGVSWRSLQRRAWRWCFSHRRLS